MIRKGIDYLESSLQGGRFEKGKRKGLMGLTLFLLSNSPMRWILCFPRVKWMKGRDKLEWMKGGNKILPQISILGMDCKFLFHCGNMRQIKLVLTTLPHSSHYYKIHFTDKGTKTLKVNSTSKVTQVKSERLKVLNSGYPDPSIYDLNILGNTSIYIRKE